MSVRSWVVTGVPPGAQEAARTRGVARRLRLRTEGKSDNTMKHRVRGQEVHVFSGGDEARALAKACQREMEARGLIATFRRWRPKS